VPKRRFTREFKRQAVQLLRDSGKSATQIAKELGVSATALLSWQKKLVADEKTGLTPDELEELAQLRKDKARLEMEVEILKKATAFFARESK